MKIPPRFRAGPSLVLIIFAVSACRSTTPTASSPTPPSVTMRIAEHRADYDALPAATRNQLAGGIIAKGQSMKLVYLALGRPDRIVTTPDGKTITWTYRNYVSPIVSSNRVVIGDEAKTLLTNGSSLHDAFEAWRYGLLKHEVPYGPEGNDPTLWSPQVIPKAPTQSWSEYGKYRKKLAEVGGGEGRANPAALPLIKAVNKRAELAYEEAITRPPIASPDPIKLDIIFAELQVSDAIIDDSFSAFSTHVLPLPITAAPGQQTQLHP